MLLDRFKKFIDGVAEDAETLFARVTDKKTFTRVVCASLLIARADGNFDSDEKAALAKIIAKDFPQFKLADIIVVLDEAGSKIEFDETMGVSELMDEIAKASGSDAELIVRTACFIGAADGDFDADEQKVATKICKRMGLSPAAYGL